MLAISHLAPGLILIDHTQVLLLRKAVPLINPIIMIPMMMGTTIYMKKMTMIGTSAIIYNSNGLINTTATSFTFVPVGPVIINPFTFSRAW